MLDSPIYFWLIAELLLLLTELLTPGFVIACFDIGALLTILPAALGASITWQVITSCIGSILALLLLHPVVRRLSRNKESARTGVKALYRRIARVTECIDASRRTGHIIVDGDNWRTRTVAPNVVIPHGEIVRIASNDSIVMIARPITQSAE